MNSTSKSNCIMDGKGRRMFLVNVSEKNHEFQKIWRKNELIEVSPYQTWLEVFEHACPTLYRQLMMELLYDEPRLKIQLASSTASDPSDLLISVRRDQQVKCALEFRPSLDVVHFELTSRRVDYPSRNFFSGNGVSSMGGSTDAAGDAAPRPLRSRDESLEEGLASVRIGGEHPESCPSPRPEATGAEEDKGARALALAEIKAAAMASQQDAFDKLGKGNNSSV
ncbi:uncharacterized protein LOC119719257 isoform X2 [Patiria miniata]|uniref:Uncharacterized protein n=1 Tax=Patiria miniata TaxID=46514 RepID=A0A913YYC6_PATMI|nr:uncharacterized protein LOC119719257 isoform X2 [Patiria miniata]